MTIIASRWSRFRGGSSFETWAFDPPHRAGRSFTFTLALRPHVHSILNQSVTVRIQRGKGK
jgi:hypothetical protein